MPHVRMLKSYCAIYLLMLNISSENEKSFGAIAKMLSVCEIKWKRFTSTSDGMGFASYFSSLFWWLYVASHMSKWDCAQAYCESCRTNYAKRHDFHFFFFFIFHLVFFIWHSPWTKNYAEKHNICRNCEQSTTHQCSLKSAIEICQREAHIFLVSNFILSKQVTILRKIDAKTS